jgi:NAD(P)-dependent dehydrogenase (short-subunit alcohol dehydrogenase family)
MWISMNNQVVLVTGASGGIGAAIAQLMADAGAMVIVHYNRNKSAATNVIENLKGKGHLMVQADLSNPSEVEHLVDQITSRYQRLDVLVNNAGFYQEIDFLELTFKDWQKTWNRTININLTGTINLSFLVAKMMKKQGGGKMINITSRGAFRGEPTAPAYGAAKAAVNSFGQSFAKALAKDNIYVFTIAPGFVNTAMLDDAVNQGRAESLKSQSPLNRFAEPIEIARIAVFLASEGTENMTGCIIDSNGASYLRT